MYKKDYDMVLSQLRKMFNCEITINKITPCHDDDFEECFAIVADGVILGNPEFGLEYNAKNIYDYLLSKYTRESNLPYELL